MKKFCAAAAAVLAAAIAPGCQSKNETSVKIEAKNNVPASLLATAQKFADNLGAGGYEFAQGYWLTFGIEQCRYAIETMGNCYANNPVAPYINAALPPWPEEFRDERTKNAFGLPKDGYETVFRVDPREAIVILARIPPKSAYFGIQPYEFTRPGSTNEFQNDEIYMFLGLMGNPALQKLLFDTSPNPERLRIFGSIGNSVNNVVMEGQSGAAFDQDRYFIITADKGAERGMKDALAKAGVKDANQVFTMPISSRYRIGLDKDAYDFLIWVRYALPVDQAAGAKWRQDLPMVVIRARSKGGGEAAEPYDTVALDKRTAEAEDGYAQDLRNVVDAVKAAWNQPDAEVKNLLDMQKTADLVGPHCNSRGMNCLGETQDTTYQTTSFPVTLDNGEVYALVGTLGTKTGNASYSNLAVNTVSTLMGVHSIDNGTLEGTASKYASLTGQSEKFYIQYFTRDCGTLPSSAWHEGSPPNCFSIGKDIVAEGEQVRIIQRNYMRPGTARGPDSAKLLAPMVVILSGAK
jgi:hypothetical protein